MFLADALRNENVLLVIHQFGHIETDPVFIEDPKDFFNEGFYPFRAATGNFIEKMAEN